VTFLLDQDVYAVTERFLTQLGYEVETASAAGLSTADDSVLLALAQERDRIFVTRDRDFGGLVFVRGEGPGVLYLRVTPATVNAVHDALRIVLERYEESDLRKAFVVVEPGRHRYRPFAK
jgi:predicted nuclease of predicted toxin-antitoxin system